MGGLSIPSKRDHASILDASTRRMRCSSDPTHALTHKYAFLSSEGLSARKKPGNFEYAIANYAMSVSIPAAAKMRKNPLTADSHAIAEAKMHFKEQCAVCHAEDGTGKTELAAGLGFRR